MKQIAFHRESDFFEDILEDPTLKKPIELKITWHNGLLIQLADSDAQLLSYVHFLIYFASIHFLQLLFLVLLFHIFVLGVFTKL